MDNLINAILLNRFRVDAYVASGGMSTVYRVWDMERNVPLAMKVLHLDLSEDPSLMKRFEREARALKRLAHPHIVSSYGFYQANDQTFILEQFIDGPTLRQYLKQRGGRLPLSEALIFMKAVSAALGYAHLNGVVHCDIKPGNIMIDRRGNIFLTDFGVARHADSTTTTLGNLGTPAYMAPEQIRGESVAPATDVYAMAIMLYEILAGVRPFQARDGAGLASGGASSGAVSSASEWVRMAHLTHQPPDPRSFNPEIPVELAQVILAALAKNMDERYANANQFFSAICAALAADPALIPDYCAAPQIEAAPSFPAAALPVQPKKLPVALIALSSSACLAAVLGVVILGFFRLLPKSLTFVSPTAATLSRDTALATDIFTEIPPTPTLQPAQDFAPTQPPPTENPTLPPTQPPPPTDTPPPPPTATPSSYELCFINLRSDFTRLVLDSRKTMELWQYDKYCFSNVTPGEHLVKSCIIKAQTPTKTTLVDCVTTSYTVPTGSSAPIEIK